MALKEAAKMREHGEDPHHIAKALLNCNYRLKNLEKVLRAAELYLHSGQSSTEHRNLVSAINTYHALDNKTSGEDVNGSGFL